MAPSRFRPAYVLSAMIAALATVASAGGLFLDGLYHPTGVVYALDLTLLVPALALSAVWLWQRQPWGYVLSGVLLVKASTYGLTLIAMSPFAARAGVPGAWDLVPLWAVLEAGSLAAGLSLFGNLRPPASGTLRAEGTGVDHPSGRSE